MSPVHECKNHSESADADVEPEENRPETPELPAPSTEEERNLAPVRKLAPILDQAAEQDSAPSSDDDEDEKSDDDKESKVPPAVSRSSTGPPRKILATEATRKASSATEGVKRAAGVPPTKSLASKSPRKSVAAVAEDDDVIYTYEVILAAARDRKGAMLFLVRWKGCPLSDATLEPASSFADHDGHRAFEITLLRKLFQTYKYKFLPRELCNSSTGWRAGKVLPQLTGSTNTYELIHFKLSYWSFNEVNFKLVDRRFWDKGFKGTRSQINMHIPVWAMNKIHNQKPDDDDWNDEDYLPPGTHKRKRI